MNHFALAVVGILTLLLIASLALRCSERLKFPFTIFLFIVGFGLFLLAQVVPGLENIFGIRFSPDILFYIFLPTLLFESSYKMSYRHLIKDALPIFWLAVVGLCISTAVIAGLGYFVFEYFLDLHIPFIIFVLFGAIVSATDPVAVLAIFKDFGVPKRLEMIFDGESVFNDGTALALFLVVLDIARSGVFQASGVLFGILTFLSMLILGIIYGVFAGITVSRIIGKVKNSPVIEITLMMALAHLTFISAEIISHFVSEHGGAFSFLRISPVIATAIAAVCLGNYGKYKISPPVFKAMDLYWGYFAFIANALIFLMMGFVIGTLDVPWASLWFPILVSIFIVAFARAISIYGSLIPLNFFLRHKIPMIWQHLLSYGSLRGGLALAMVMLLVPSDFVSVDWNLPYTPIDFLKAMILGCIIFTLVIKATTFGAFMRWFHVGEYSPDEKFTDRELSCFVSHMVLKNLEKMREQQFLLPKSVEEVSRYYKNMETSAHKDLCCLVESPGFNARAVEIVALYALGIEKYAAEELFTKGYITEDVIGTIADKIEDQVNRIENNEKQIRIDEPQPFIFRAVEAIKDRFFTTEYQRVSRKYLYYFAREEMCVLVRENLETLCHDFGDDIHLKSAFSEIQKRYLEWHDLSAKKRKKMMKDFSKLSALADYELAQRTAEFSAVSSLEYLHEHRIVPEKVYGELLKVFQKSLVMNKK